MRALARQDDMNDLAAGGRDPTNHATTYQWTGLSDPAQYAVLWDPLLKILAEEHERGVAKEVCDLGSGNGITAEMLTGRGFRVTGIEPSEDGVIIARGRAPHATFHIGSAYDDLASLYGRFPIVICMEVIEHCYYPRKLARTFFDLIAPEGVGIMTTPYHGYLKNLALAVTGTWDRHLTALWDGGHIKFFSVATLRAVLKETGATDIRIIRVGRIPPLAKSMIAIVRKS